MIFGPHRAQRAAYERIHHSGARWEVRREWGERLFADSARPWFELKEDSRAQCVKEGDGRSTWRVRISGHLEVFVKVFDDPGSFSDLLKVMLAVSPAERERASANAAYARGIPVAKCLAIGCERGIHGRRILISESIADAVPLSQAWLHAISPRASGQVSNWNRRQLIQCVAELFATAHENGFSHSDAHPENILVRQTANQYEAYFIDFSSADVGWFPHSVEKGAFDLAQINQWGQRNTSAAERMQFLRHYLRRRLNVSPKFVGREGERVLSQLVNCKSAIHAAHLGRIRDRRLHQDGRYFARLRLTDHWTARVVLKLERRHVFPEDDIPDRTAEEWNALLANNLSNVTTGSGPTDVQLHRVRTDSVLSQLHWTLTGSPCRRAFMQAHQLRHRDLAAPLILGYAEHRSSRGLIDQAVMMIPSVVGSNTRPDSYA
ncbi:MAG: phosphotransferase [Planctomycetes bacterium]|nr:phosphotransferase [Planctomycetota bacterium]MBI3834028.1 phosphotransferase [Planctomycetota bacterium]